MSEDKAERFMEAIVDYANATEAAVVNLKRQIAEIVGVASPAATAAATADFNKLFWEKKEGVKGPYEQTSKRATNNSDIFQALQAKLREHNGFWQHRAFKFWFHQQNQDIIDRRKT